MTKVNALPYYSLRAEDLANWLDAEPETWWIVDGDPLLTSLIDFPCPEEELSMELHRVNKSLRLFDPRTDSSAHGQPLDLNELEGIADRDNNSKARTYLLSWEDNDLQWLLSEYPGAGRESA